VPKLKPMLMKHFTPEVYSTAVKTAVSRTSKLDANSLEVLGSSQRLTWGETGDLQRSGTVVKASRMSIILPMYNEQSCIGKTFDTLLAFAHNHPDYDFIFVNDGSTDETPTILEKHLLMAGEVPIQCVSYPNRRGKGFAVHQGMYHASGEYVCFIDSDLAYSLDHLNLLLEELHRFDVVIGCRNLVAGSTQELKPSRKIAGKVFNWLSQWILHLRFSDMQAGLKGFRTVVARELFSRQQLSGFAFDVELIYLACKHGYSVGKIPARVSAHHPKKLSKVNLVQDSLKMLADLFKIRWNDLIGRYE